MKVTITEEACIGCGACAATLNEIFKINDDGIAYAINENINESNINEINNVMDSCPTGAINIK